MAEKIDEWAAKWQTKGGRPGLGDFEELLLGYTQH